MTNWIAINVSTEARIVIVDVNRMNWSKIYHESINLILVGEFKRNIRVEFYEKFTDLFQTFWINFREKMKKKIQKRILVKRSAFVAAHSTCKFIRDKAMPKFRESQLLS